MPAYKAGLKEGDRILAVNGKAVATWDDLPISLRGLVDRDVALMVERGGQRFPIHVKPINPDGGPGENALIGIEAPRHGVYMKRYSLVESVVGGFLDTAKQVVSVYASMWLTVSRPLYYR